MKIVKIKLQQFKELIKRYFDCRAKLKIANKELAFYKRQIDEYNQRFTKDV